jgi:hypothetical protein
MVLHDMLDRHPPALCEEMVHKPDKKGRGNPNLAVPRLQLTHDGGAEHLPLLVWQGYKSQKYPRIAATFLWSDLFEAEGNMSPSMPSRVSRRAVSTLQADGPDSIMFLRKA